MTEGGETMNPDEKAREAGRNAVDASRRTLEAIEDAMEGNRWRTAQTLYLELHKQSELGVTGCQRMVQVKRELN